MMKNDKNNEIGEFIWGADASAILGISRGTLRTRRYVGSNGEKNNDPAY